jgi:prophage regulatory protein
MRPPEGSSPISLLRLPAVMARTGLSKSHIWRLAKRGDFPPPIHLGRAAAWPSNQVEEWITAAIASERGGAGDGR